MQTIWLDQRRAYAVRGQPVDPEELHDLPGLDGRRVTDCYLTLQAVRRVASELPDEQRLVLALVAVDGLSYKEAAATLGVPMGTVMSRLARARQRIIDRVLDQANDRPKRRTAAAKATEND